MSDDPGRKPTKQWVRRALVAEAVVEERNRLLEEKDAIIQAKNCTIWAQAGEIRALRGRADQLDRHEPVMVSVGAAVEPVVRGERRSDPPIALRSHLPNGSVGAGATEGFAMATDASSKDAPIAERDGAHRAEAPGEGVTTPLLEVRDLDVRYGPARALFGVSLDVAPGSVLAVLGVNGAGKSTLARTVSGLVAPTAGRVSFDGKDITGLPAHRIRRLGLTHIPEGRGIFPGLSVTDNLRMAVAQEQREVRSTAIERAIERFPVLGKRPSQRAGSLSGGEQQMLALARAFAVSPKLIIADELSLGLAPGVTESVFQSLDEVRSSGITVVLSEQFVHRALTMADSCVILTRGRVGWAGPASDASREVLDRYLGEAEPELPPVAAGGGG